MHTCMLVTLGSIIYIIISLAIGLAASSISKEQCVYIALCVLSFQFIVALELGLI